MESRYWENILLVVDGLGKVRCENLEERVRDGLELEGWRVDVRVEKPRTSTCGRYMPR
jgi:hypothetical protein